MKNTLMAARIGATALALAIPFAFAGSDIQRAGGAAGSTIIEGNVGDDNHYILECGGQCLPSLVGAAIGPEYTGAWFDPSQSGHGLFVEILPDNKIQAAWFTFNAAGTEQAWFLGVGTYAGNTATINAVAQPTGGRWIPNFDPKEVVNNAWGSLNLTFTDRDHGNVYFSSTQGYGTGTMSLTRLTDPSAAYGPWALTGPLNIARFGHTMTLLPNGKVLAAGGGGYLVSHDYDILDSSELYDPATGKWSVTGRMNEPRFGHTATLLSDGRVLVAGSGTAELYDPATAIWSRTGSPISNRWGHTATLLQDGKVLVAGGYGATSADGAFDYLGSAELYDPATGTWSATGSLSDARCCHTATLLQDGRVLVDGGSNDIDDGIALSSAELYDPGAGAWTRTGAAFLKGYSHTATLLPGGGKVLVAGLDEGNARAFSAELFDPATGMWSLTGGLNQTREAHTATLLPTGDVLVAGGSRRHFNAGTDSVESIDFAGAELYNPGTAKWSAAGNLNFARASHAATLLPDGRILVAGGLANGGTLSSAELYTTPVTAPTGAGFTGSWYDPAQSGHGLVLEELPGSEFLAAWFTFNPAGTQQSWFLGVGTYSVGTATITSVLQPTGGRWIPNFDPTKIVNNAWGSLKFTFDDCDHGKVDFNSTLGYGTGSMSLTRLTHPTGFVCSFSPWDY